MALAKKCDICGKLFEYQEMTEHDTTPVNRIVLAHNGVNINSMPKTIQSLDSCPECTEAVAETLNRLARVDEEGVKPGEGEEAKEALTEEELDSIRVFRVSEYEDELQRRLQVNKAEMNAVASQIPDIYSL